MALRRSGVRIPMAPLPGRPLPSRAEAGRRGRPRKEISPRLAARRLPVFIKAFFSGWVAEWSNAHAWKACVQQCTEGSNPSPSATCRRQLKSYPRDENAVRAERSEPKATGLRWPLGKRPERSAGNPSPSAIPPQASSTASLRLKRSAGRASLPADAGSLSQFQQCHSLWL